MKSQQTRKLSISQRFINFAYNTRYKALGYFQQYKKQQIIKPYDRIYILGKKFEASEQDCKVINQQIYVNFSSTIWITYRSGFTFSSEIIQDEYITDTGWGCMIRVGQMLFAQILKKHQNAQTKTKMFEIISHFNDIDKNALFSIQNISRIARKQYDIKPGAWYNPSQITNLMCQLFSKHNKTEYQDLQILPFFNSQLFFDQIINVMAANKKLCKCTLQEKKLICNHCNVCKKSVAVIILTRIGFEKPQPKYLEVLDKIMESQHFQGLIGGKPEKALYFLGKHNKQYIYLDPHFIHTARSKNQEKKQSYFCQSFRKCKNTAIQPSLGICFYFRNLRQINNFYNFMREIKAEAKKDFFIYMEKETPLHMRNKKQNKDNQQQQNEQQGFQFL